MITQKKINKMGNISSAVMNQRQDTKKTELDDFPTPPWATRALTQNVLRQYSLGKMSCLEPACNRGHMADALKETFKDVTSSDVQDYGYKEGSISDFLHTEYDQGSFDWVITNPPFKDADKFILKALSIAKVGIAMLCRTALIEGVSRYEKIYSKLPPSKVSPFVERVPMFKGQLDDKKSSATSYTWFVWEKDKLNQATVIEWIGPCRRDLVRDGDYRNRPFAT